MSLNQMFAKHLHIHINYQISISLTIGVSRIQKVSFAIYLGTSICYVC